MLERLKFRLMIIADGGLDGGKLIVNCSSSVVKELFIKISIKVSY